MKYPLALRHLFMIAGTIFILGSAYAEPPPTLFHATDIVQDISDTTTIRQRFVYVETGLLSTNDQIFLNLFEDVSFVATLSRVEKLSKGGIAWTGHIDSVQESEVTLISRGNQMAANIVLPGAFYQLRYAGEGVHVIKEIDQSKFPPEAPPIPVESSPSSEQWWGADADDGSSIDVLVVYTEAAKNTVGGQTAMENLIDLAVTETNTGYANSLVIQRLNLVHTAQVSYDETGFDWSQTLRRLRDTTDGYMDNVHTLRDAYQADEVVLIVDSGGYCGIGYMMTTVSQSFESSAFAVVRYSCATGYYSFGHELGHNMGSHHDRANANGSGAFDYSYGYQAPDNSFRTVMAYNCSGGCPRVNHWSNPNVDYNSQPTGIIDTSPQSAFNAKSLNNTAFTVANFRQSQSSKQTLSVTKNGTGSGTITSSPTGINCGNDCSHDYDSGTEVTLTATPNSGSTFEGWSGSCSGTSCSVTMDANHTVNANFEQNTGTNCAAVTEIPSTECEALVTLYNSTNGDSWTDNSGWLETNTPCGWSRVTCSGGHVSGIGLDSNQLIGTIPPELGNLSNLTSLTLSNNQLTGTIPPELGNLSNLTHLQLSSNELTGIIPPELGNLSNLTHLSLNSNQLTGTIPPELGNLSNLEWLWLNNNQLTGIPPELGNLSNLKYLYLWGNQLSGTIPPELGNLSNLEWLYLWGNQLSGTIPPELGNLSNLTHLSLNSNQLTGIIPPELGNLSNLTRLWLSVNQLTDIIPPELGNLSNLTELSLYSNQLCGEIPSELMNLTNLGDSPYGLRLQNNNLINTDTTYPANLITWLDEKNPIWRTQISPTYCSEMRANDVVIDFGPEYGIWAWMNNTSWADIHSLSPKSMVIGDIDDSGQDDIIIDFGEPNGIWIFQNNNTWVKLHSSSADSMTTGNIDAGSLADVIIDFGSQYAIYVWMNNSDWSQLHTLSPESLITGDMDGNGQDEVIIDFGETYGIWVRMNNSSWTQLHTLSPESMTTGNIDAGSLSDVIIDFGSPYGIWIRMNNNEWAQLHSLSPESMTTGDMDGNGQDEIIIDFGESYGIYVWKNNSTWVKLHSLSPKSMTTGYLDNNALADVIIDFGSPYGIWARMNNDSWVQLHTISAESMVTGNIDGQASPNSNNITAQEIPAAELDNGEPLPEVEPISLPVE